METTANNVIRIMREKLDKAGFKAIYKPRLEEMNKYTNFSVAGFQSEARTKDILTLNQDCQSIMRNFRLT